MYLLYLDESGNPDDPSDRHFILGGAAIFERSTYFVSTALDELKRRHFPSDPPIEFHATDIRAGKGFWRRVAKEKREDLIDDLGSAIVNSAQWPGLVFFAAAVEKDNVNHGEQCVRRATEEICDRFDIFLKNRRRAGDEQRGLLVFAEGRYRERSKIWVSEFRDLGTSWRTINLLSDVPYFVPAKETRLLQVADYVAHATFLLYEKRNARLFRPLMHRFDEKNGKLHGLVHVGGARRCECPACASRRRRDDFGSWL